jgi:transposase
MYLRRSVRHKNGKAHTYWRLVRSVRRQGKVVQETIAHLGELDARGRAKAQALARQIMGSAAQRELFEGDSGSDQTVAVRLDRIRLERGRRFGDVWFAWKIWQALQLDEACEALLGSGRESVSWATMAAVLVLARLCEPSSELHIAESFYERTSLEDILGLPAAFVNADRLYRALDHLLPHKEALEKHLVRRLGELFSLDYDLLLYDVTSTYFEGMSEGNDLARRGHSRDRRPDCTQVCIALVVTRDGMPLGYEVFPGNRTDVTTVEEIVETMERRFGLADRIWVMDRGMVSTENLAWLEQTGRRYLIGTPRSELKRWRGEIAETEDWQEVREGVEAKLCPGPEGEEMFLLCRSRERREKEVAIHERFSQRIEAGLEKLQGRLARSRKALDRGPIERQIGRLLERNQRAAGRYQIELKKDPRSGSGWRVVWSPRAKWDEWAQHSEGCYVLRTNITEWNPEELWRTYIQLTQAEAAFRIQKSELSLRPVWHQKAERVQAHILVCFLAYVLWKTLEQWQRRAGLGNSPRRILDEMRDIQSADIVLPLAENAKRTLRIRCVVRPDKAQAALLDRLGLRLPERLRAPVPTLKM